MIGKVYLSLQRFAALMATACALGGCGTTEPISLETWHTLVLDDWTMLPGTETTIKVHFIPDRDYLVTAIRPVAPPGTHHITLSRPGEAHDVLWVAVVGTGMFMFPQGVGLRLHAGETLDVGFHFFNATSANLSGTSGIEVIEAEPGTDIEEANILTSAIRNLTLPPGAASASGKCTITEDQTFFAVEPHMHVLGKHLTATLVQGDTEKTLYDDGFNWDAQAFVPMSELHVNKGDFVNLRCDWQNTTGMPVTLGLAASQEMCSAFIYRYPAGDSNYCTE